MCYNGVFIGVYNTTSTTMGYLDKPTSKTDWTPEHTPIIESGHGRFKAYDSRLSRDLDKISDIEDLCKVSAILDLKFRTVTKIRALLQHESLYFRANEKTTLNELIAVSRVEALKILDLSDIRNLNSQKDKLEAVGKFKSITHLDINSSDLTDEGLKHLENLSNLQSLNLFGTQITDKGLQHLQGLSNLQYLNLGWTNITDKGFKYIQSLPNLKTLLFYDLQISKPNNLQNLPNLKALSLANVKLYDGLEHIQHMSNLELLDLERAVIRDEGLKYLQSLPNLKSLNLNDTRIGDEGFEHIKNLPNLQHLKFGRTNITEQGFKYLSSLTNLKSLYLYKTILSQERFQCLENLSNLQTLTLQNCTFDPKGHESLKKALPQCEVHIL